MSNPDLGGSFIHLIKRRYGDTQHCAHDGKTKLWNSAVHRPQACNMSSKSACRVDPAYHVWRGPPLPAARALRTPVGHLRFSEWIGNFAQPPESVAMLVVVVTTIVLDPNPEAQVGMCGSGVALFFEELNSPWTQSRCLFVETGLHGGKAHRDGVAPRARTRTEDMFPEGKEQARLVHASTVDVWV